jgi:hypothetical protein
MEDSSVFDNGPLDSENLDRQRRRRATNSDKENMTP